MSGKEGTAKQILACYHPTATYDSSDFNPMDIAYALEEVMKRGDSGEIRISTANIYFAGLTQRKYRLTHAFDFKWRHNPEGLYDYWVRFPIISETSMIPGDNNCYLKDWVPFDF